MSLDSILWPGSLRSVVGEVGQSTENDKLKNLNSLTNFAIIQYTYKVLLNFVSN